MPFSLPWANWVRRGVIVFLAIWLLAEVPVVCQNGPMSLFDLGAHKDHMRHGGLSAGHRLAKANPVSLETAFRLILASPQHDLMDTTLLETMTGVSEGSLPILAI